MFTRLRFILPAILALAVAFWLGEHFDEWRRPRPLEAGSLRYTGQGLEYEIVNPGATKYTAKSIAFYVTHVADGPPPKHDYAPPKDVQQIMVGHTERQADRGWFATCETNEADGRDFFAGVANAAEVRLEVGFGHGGFELPTGRLGALMPSYSSPIVLSRDN